MCINPMKISAQKFSLHFFFFKKKRGLGGAIIKSMRPLEKIYKNKTKRTLEVNACFRKDSG